jgi:DNA excision repair protein ERCC-2
VAGAAETGLGLVVSAPTGIGKTAAAAVPLLRSALATNRRLMIVTAKVSQQGMYLDLLERLIPAGREVMVSQLEARERSCPQGEMLCSVHACPLLREAARPEPMAAVRATLARGGVVRAEALRTLAAAHRLCPFEVGLLAAGIADVVVGDLNYAFHPQAALERFFEPGGRRRLLLVDEAHNLPSRAQDFLSPRLGRGRIRTLAEGCLHGGHPVFSRILPFLLSVEAMLTDLASEAARQPDGYRAVTEVSLDRERLALLCGDAEDWLLDYLAYAKSGLRRPPAFVPRNEPGARRVIDPFLSFCYDLLHLGRAAEERGDHMTALLRRTPDEVELEVFCKDPARYLAACHRRFDAVVAMSATLEPLAFFADVLGVSRLRSFASCAFPSPFDPANRCLVVDTSVSTRYARRMAELPGACRTMAALAALRPGNYLAFFPSYEVLGTAAVFLRAAGPDLQVVAQAPGAGADPLLADLAAAAERRARSPGHGSLIAAVVIGGSLAEGVDLAGELCTGAFIFGPGLPAVTEERALMQAYYDQEYGSGFEYAYLYPGLARVVQAAGRVIRGPEERGVIVLFDERFAEPRYRDLLPGYWRDELATTTDPVPVVSAFWSGSGAGGAGGSTAPGPGGSAVVGSGAGGAGGTGARRKSQRSSTSSS